MCGIAGCVGHHDAPGFILDGLSALEKRGYDSTGGAFLDLNPHDDSEIWTPRLKVIKALGDTGLSELPLQLTDIDRTTTTAIGHNRWATHGGVTTPNGHPHINEAGTVGVVHNGIILNFERLRSELEEKGYPFRSETDTEVIPHLIQEGLDKGQDPEEAFIKAIRRLDGMYAILAYMVTEPDTIYAARQDGPLVLGVNGYEHFVASQPSAWIDHTKKAIRLEDGQIAKISAGEKPKIWSELGRRLGKNKIQILDEEDYKKAERDPRYKHWMLQEIHEQPRVVQAAINGRVYPDRNLIKLGGLESPEEDPEKGPEDQTIKEKIQNMKRIVIVGCGTSYHAGMIGEYLIEELTAIPVEIDLSAKFNDRIQSHPDGTALLAISQSGETADTLMAVRKAKNQHMLALGINNSPGSTLAHETDAGVHCRAGEEEAVASTKAFTAQVVALSEIALALSPPDSELRHRLMQELVLLPSKIESILENKNAIKEVAHKYTRYKHFLYIGRHYDHATALEGALKLAEISYIHAEGMEAGEMKHGKLALVGRHFPTFAIATNGSTYKKMESNISELRARESPIIAIATEGNEAIQELANDVIYVPETAEQLQPILNTVVTQLFAYYIAVRKRKNVDKPRHLAKTVTVE